MHSDEARQQADAAAAAYHDASRPALPLGLSIGCGLQAGLGVALLGVGVDGTLKAITFLSGLVLLVSAFVLPSSQRNRAGLHGYRGTVQRDNLTFLTVAVALAVLGLNATPALGVIFAGLGVVSGVAYFLLLRGRMGRSA